MAKHLISFWVLVCFTFPVFSQSQNLLFSGFKSDADSNMSLSGGAKIDDNGLLLLTNDSLRVLGHAFYAYPVQFKNSSDGKMMSFSTAFVFAIQPKYQALGGHGFAFTVCSNKDLFGALPSQYLGLMNASDIGNVSNHVFAVEFDTVQDFEFGDIDDNHVGVDINSLVSNKSVSASYYGEDSVKRRLDLKSGVKIQAWIDYDSGNKQLTVKLSPSSIKPTTPILSFDVDLSLLFEDFMYIGFSASTGLLSSSHCIMGWSFQMNGEAKSFALSSLPSLPVPATSNKVLVIGVSVSVVTVLILGIVVAFYIIRKIRNADVIEAWELDVGPHRFPYQELKKATRGFRDKQLLGFGGFGRVYKGTLPNTNTQIAVKRISHGSKQGFREFVSEISSIGRLRHRNLVQLLGWCRMKGDLMLVYDYMPNGSLDKYIFDKPEAILTWEQRFKIIKGVASGLLYLHEEWEQTVIHRDIKAGNVLLDAELNGRLGDFGLAKLYEHGSNPSTTRVVGTLGYLAPELTRTGKPTTSSDVFAFGALMLEVVCGRRPIEPKALPEELILVDWVWEKWRTGAILDVVDARLKGEYDEVEVIVVLKLALMCSNDSPNMRPTIRQVVRYLEGEVPLPEKVAAPGSNDEKKVSNGTGRQLEFEDYVNSYPTASYLEKVSTWSSGVDDGENDLEAGSSSPFSLWGRGDGSQA